MSVVRKSLSLIFPLKRERGKTSFRSKCKLDLGKRGTRVLGQIVARLQVVIKNVRGCAMNALRCEQALFHSKHTERVHLRNYRTRWSPLPASGLDPAGTGS